MIRPTARAVRMFAAGVPVALLPVLYDDRLWPVALAFLALALFAFGADALMAAPAGGIGISVKAPPLLYVGETERLNVSLVGARPGKWAALVETRCEVNERLAAPSDRAAVVLPGQETRFDFELQARRRGEAAVERMWLRWQGPLGFAARQRRETLNVRLPVLPNIRAVRAAAAKLFSRDALFGQKPQYQQGDGSEFDALRDYLPGLDHRAIDWKQSARHRRLVCKEFRAERNHPIILAFDTGYLMSEPVAGIPKLDHAINAGLLLAFLSLKGGDQVGLHAFDAAVRHFAVPASGTNSFQRLQHMTAGLSYRHEETNFTLGLTDLLGRLNRRSLVVLMTDFVDTVTAELMIENVARLAARHLVVCVTMSDPGLAAVAEAQPGSLEDVARAVVASDFARERAVVFERLRRLGVHCLDVSPDGLSLELLNRYLLIKQRELI
jgi:uncharacterized protein (DUF58 family)